MSTLLQDSDSSAGTRTSTSADRWSQICGKPSVASLEEDAENRKEPYVGLKLLDELVSSSTHRPSLFSDFSSCIPRSTGGDSKVRCFVVSKSSLNWRTRQHANILGREPRTDESSGSERTELEVNPLRSWNLQQTPGFIQTWVQYVVLLYELNKASRWWRGFNDLKTFRRISHYFISGSTFVFLQTLCRVSENSYVGV